MLKKSHSCIEIKDFAPRFPPPQCHFEKWQWKKNVWMKHLTRSNRNYFLSHSISEKYFLQCFGVCVPERKRTGGMQETQQYNPAMWWPPLHNLHHPLLSTTSTDNCCTVQQKSFIQHKAKHKPPDSTNTVFTTLRQWKCSAKNYREPGITKKNAFEHISNF